MRVYRKRTHPASGKVEQDVTYYATSLPPDRADARVLLAIIRRHWGVVENGVHWVRDTVLHEDRHTLSKGHAPQNMATTRNAALNWLRATGHGKFTSRIRSFARNSLKLFTKLGYRN